MMEREELRRTLESRTLTLGELLQQSFGLLTDRFGAFIVLMLMVYLPINLIQQYQLMQVDLTVEDMELMLSQLASVYLVQMVLSFLEMVAILVAAVLVHDLVFESGQLPFGTAFYRGVRMWIRAFFTMVVVLTGLILCLMSMGMLMMMPAMMMLLLPLIFLVMVIYSLMQNGICVTAALRGRMGFDNIRYVAYILKGHMGKAIGNYAAIMLLTSGISILCNLLLGNIVAYIESPWLALGVNVLFSTLLSILSLYGYVAGTLLFLNLEEGKRVLQETPLS